MPTEHDCCPVLRQEVRMPPCRLFRVAFVALCAITVLFSSATDARAQLDFGTPSQAEALSTAAKANPELANGLAKEMGATPEQAAGAAGVIFGIARSLLKPDDFAQLEKAVPGMDAFLAAVPSDVASAPGASALFGSTLSPGLASSSTTPG